MTLEFCMKHCWLNDNRKNSYYSDQTKCYFFKADPQRTYYWIFPIFFFILFGAFEKTGFCRDFFPRRLYLFDATSVKIFVPCNQRTNCYQRCNLSARKLWINITRTPKDYWVPFGKLNFSPKTGTLVSKEYLLHLIFLRTSATWNSAKSVFRRSKVGENFSCG